MPDGVVDIDGEPTSVAVTGQYALVGVNTSNEVDVGCLDDEGEPDEISYIETWDGKLAVIDTTTRAVVAEISLQGQPDAVTWIGDDATATANEGDYETARWDVRHC